MRQQRLPHWSTWLLAGTGLWVAASLLWHHFRWGPPGYRLLISAGLFPPQLLACSLLAWLAGRRPDQDPRESRGWKVFAMAFLFMAVACLLNAYYAVLGLYIFPSLADLFFWCFYPVMLWGLLSLPFSPSAGLRRCMFWVDLGIVAVAGFIVVWQYVLGPTISGSTDSLLSRVLSVAYPVGDLTLLFGLVAAGLRRPGRFEPGLTALGMGVLSLISADTVWGYQVHRTAYQPGSLAESLWCVAYLLFALGAWLQAGTGAASPAERPAAGSPSRGYKSHLTVAISYAILVLFSYRYAEKNSLIYAALMAASVLLVLRQYLTNLANVRAEQTSQSLEGRFRALVQNSADVISILSAQGECIYRSPAFERLLGYPAGLVPDGGIESLVHPADLSLWLSSRARVIDHPAEIVRIELQLRHCDGTWRHTEVVAQNLLDNPDVQGIVLHTRDVSVRKELEQVVRHQATHDSLTDLANRTCFVNRLEQLMVCPKTRPRDLAVLMVDLDNFKPVNDTLGHAAGDDLLVTVAARLREAAGEHLVARWGGDEFAVLLTGAGGAEVELMAGRLLAAIVNPITVQKRKCFVTGSIGIALAELETPAHELLRRADVAMYAAKKAGKNRHALFDPKMPGRMEADLNLAAELREALANGEFTLRYQPVCDLQSGKIIGLEALVRWQHPVRGLLSPGSFISLAEETGMIVPLGRWVLFQACRQLAAWRRRYPAAAGLTVGVNLSVKELLEDDVAAAVQEILRKTGLPPDALVAEITESIWPQEFEAVLQNVRQIKQTGVFIALDDFGAGFSTLGHLRWYPVDVVKIDRSLVGQVEVNPAEKALVRGIIDLANSLGMMTVVEGIERRSQQDELFSLGCKYGQGYLLATPLTAAEFEAQLRSGSRIDSTPGSAPASDLPRLCGW